MIPRWTVIGSLGLTGAYLLSSSHSERPTKPTRASRHQHFEMFWKIFNYVLWVSVEVKANEVCWMSRVAGKFQFWSGNSGLVWGISQS